MKKEIIITEEQLREALSSLMGSGNGYGEIGDQLIALLESNDDAK